MCYVTAMGYSEVVTTILKTRTKAPYVIAYVGPKGATIEGYAYTVAAGTKRAARMGRNYKVLPVVGGKVIVGEGA